MPRSRLHRLFTTPLQLTRRGVLYGALVLLVLLFVPLIVASSRWLLRSKPTSFGPSTRSACRSAAPR